MQQLLFCASLLHDQDTLPRYHTTILCASQLHDVDMLPRRRTSFTTRPFDLNRHISVTYSAFLNLNRHISATYSALACFSHSILGP